MICESIFWSRELAAKGWRDDVAQRVDRIVFGRLEQRLLRGRTTTLSVREFHLKGGRGGCFIKEAFEPKSGLGWCA